MATDPAESGFPCENCNKAFESKGELDEHMRENHGLTPEEAATRDRTEQDERDERDDEEDTAENPEELDSVDYRGHAPEDIEDDAERDDVDIKGGGYKTENADRTEEESISERYERTGDDENSAER